MIFPRVIASDLDGTLLRSDGTVDQRTRESLAEVQAAGATVVICTARPMRWMSELAEELPHGGVAICVNGAVVWDLHSREALEAFPLMPEVAREAVELLGRAIPGASWAVERISGHGREPAYRSRWPTPPDALIADIDALITEPAVKLMLRHEALLADALLELAVPAAGHLVELTHSNSNDGLLEITAAGISKASTLALWCERHDVRGDQVIAFGDMPNDLPMLAWAGRGVAVANAHPDVLATADEVTASNDEHGVAIVLERLLVGSALQRERR